MIRAIRFAFFIACVLAGGAVDAADDSAQAGAQIWAALRGDGHVALIRHAAAPGPAGDPTGYRLDDCKSQRNLSEQGRADARALGDLFRAQQVKVGKVVSSQWCRCRQTAELMNIGPVEDAPAFNNAFVLSAHRAALTAGARATIAAWRGPGSLVIATHGANIQALLGFRPVEGEVVVVAPDPANAQKMRLVGRIGRS
ncbi:MAG: histidine phosphatase family protein [Pseudolabrys sp.]|nr:histidine phosphatase family protein [Pseudolabrys sp.]